MTFPFWMYLFVAQKLPSLSSLFANSEDGDEWIMEKPYLFTKSSGGVINSVTTTGDLVFRATGLHNGLNFEQDDPNKRPAYMEGGGLSWIRTDKVDDGLDLAIQFNGSRWSFAMSYTPDGGNFILMSLTGNSSPWAGVGQSGSANLNLLHLSLTQNAIYFGNSLSAATTRDGQYDLAQAANTVLLDFTSSSNWASNRLGRYGNPSNFNDPGDVHSVVLINRALTTAERNLVHQKQSEQAGVAA